MFKKTLVYLLAASMLVVSVPTGALAEGVDPEVLMEDFEEPEFVPVEPDIVEAQDTVPDDADDTDAGLVPEEITDEADSLIYEEDESVDIELLEAEFQEEEPVEALTEGEPAEDALLGGETDEDGLIVSEPEETGEEAALPLSYDLTYEAMTLMVLDQDVAGYHIYEPELGDEYWYRYVASESGFYHIEVTADDWAENKALL